MNPRIVYGGDGPRYFTGGREVTAKEFYKLHPPQGLDGMLLSGVAPDGSRSACWPMLSEALAVHPSQIREASEATARAGVPTEYVRDGPNAGKAVLRDRSHRRALLRLEGMHDKSGGYGD